jgi:glycerophosphoryl diester phosphodiesterase
MPEQLNIQGHRGARGLYPENTVSGFIEALKLGVNTLELDVVISADQEVVVSHEAWMNADFCSLPDGAPIEKGTEKTYNLYRMTYPEIKKFDCGKRGNPEFPMQVAIPSYKPLLDEVITQVELYIRENALAPVSYNIELKSEMKEGPFNPPPELFVDLVLRKLKKHLPDNRIHIQSFDVSLLQEVRRKDPYISIGLLVENPDDLEINLKRLGFTPQTYSPEFVLVDESLAREVHRLGMELIPWTVNEKKDMVQLISMGVDGIITDYPDRLINLVNNSSN